MWKYIDRSQTRMNVEIGTKATQFFVWAYINPNFFAVVRHVTGNDQDYLRKIPRAVVQISALL